ncbi:hypothetical protein BU15DRAFT_83278 [Melanogaster broomeanus]|nr:hypothetical protein BU15DRAFT_83278 [Melanogaster broomeanus]
MPFTEVSLHIRQVPPSNSTEWTWSSSCPTCLFPSLGGGIGACLPSQLEDFMLAGPPSSVPSMGSSVGGSDHLFNTFAFHAVPAPYPPTSAAPDMAHLQLTMSSDAEMASKYRAQAESLRRAGIPTMPGTMPLYAGQQIHQSQPQPGHWYGWGESGGFPSLDENKSFDGLGRVHSFNADVPSFAPELYDTAVVGSGYRPRRGSLDFSDSSSATSSHSVPSSATSSSVHLPLPGNEMYDSRSDDMHRQGHDPHMIQRRDSMSTSQPPSYQSHQQSQQPQPQQTHGTGEGGFSSAFGLMSIDDPNVLAGLSSDGVPFFSNVAMGIAPHSPNATPMPTRLQQQQQQQQSRDRGMSTSALPTPGLTKDADARELKDAWRTYIRTPSSGPGSAALDLSTTAAPLAQSPTGQRRRVRVSSLPSVTPTGERGHPLVANGHGGNGHAHGDASGMRMTLHGNPEDLRSYEAAVNARNAALHLNLVPRRRGTQPSVSPAAGSSSSGSAGVEQNGISRPSSSGSVSSLAHAFGVPTHHPPNPNIVKPPPLQGASISLPISSGSVSLSHSVSFGPNQTITFNPPSRESSVASDGTGGSGGSNSDGEVFRLSFKRPPSQALGPASSKRACGEGADGDLVGVKLENGVGGVGSGSGSGMDMDAGSGMMDGMGMGNGRSRQMAALPGRARRESEASMRD